MCELESSTEVEGTLTIQTCHESFSIVGKAETKDINQKSRLSLSGGRCAFFPPGLWLIRIFNRCGWNLLVFLIHSAALCSASLGRRFLSA